MKNKYGKLTIIGKPFRLKKQTHILCKCDCGAEKTFRLDLIKSGNSRSCGCARVGKLTTKTHGYCSRNNKHPLYVVWAGIIGRCENRGNTNYKYYGARGITICQEWRVNFVVFMDWCIKNQWRKGLEIDRIENNGNYEPGNCRFISHKANMTNARFLTSRNKTGYRGVSKHRQKYRGNCNQMYIGNFNTPYEAALARDKYVTDNNLNLPLNFN